MSKRKRSERRGASWLGKPSKLRPGSSARSYDPSAKLRDAEFIRGAILQAIGEGDHEAAAEIMRAHLRVLNRSRAAEGMRVSRQHVHRLIAGSRKPSLETLGAFMSLLKSERHHGAGA